MRPAGIFLLAIPTLPALAAAAIAVAQPDGERSARWALRAGTAAFLVAIAIAVVVAVGNPVSAVVERGNGEAVIGLYASRVTALLGLLTTGVGLVVQSFASRALQGDLRGRRFFILASL